MLMHINCVFMLVFGPFFLPPFNDDVVPPSPISPNRLQTVYGGDVMVPGLRGVARLAAWYSPGRKEGMMEMRMF
jgi:hypothetical protein